MRKLTLSNMNIIFILAFLLVVYFVAGEVSAEDAPISGKIAFLTLQIDAEGVNLIESNIVDGTMKTPRIANNSRELYFEAVDKNSEIVYSASEHNPLVQVYEYDDPKNPGQLISKVVVLDQTMFTIRIPYSENIENLRFFKNEPDEISGYKKSNGELIGEIAFPHNAGDDQ